MHRDQLTKSGVTRPQALKICDQRKKSLNEIGAGPGDGSALRIDLPPLATFLAAYPGSSRNSAEPRRLRQMLHAGAVRVGLRLSAMEMERAAGTQLLNYRLR